MAKTTQTANPFGTLTHSAYVPTYVGLPIARMKETADVLQNKYNTAIANRNTTKTQLAQIPLNEWDEKLRTNALKGFNGMMAGFEESGNYEDANTTIANGATDIATNSGLIAAIKSKAERVKQNKIEDLQVQAGQADQKDVDYVRGVAKDASTATGGVYLNEETGAWEGGYNAESIPKIQNIGEIANKFLKSYKANTYLGQYVKMKNPDSGELVWFDTTGGKTDDSGAFIVQPSTEIAKIEDVMYVAQKQLMQDPAVAARLAFEMKRDGVSFNTVTAAMGGNPDARRVDMQADLVVNGGYDENRILQLDDEELALVYEKNRRVSNDISGAAGSRASITETQQLYGASWEARRQKALADADAPPPIIKVLNENATATTGAHKISGLQLSVQEHVEQQNTFDATINTQIATNNQLRTKIKAEKLKGNNVSGLKNTLAKSQMLVDELREKRRVDNINWNLAVEETQTKLGIPDVQKFVEEKNQLDVDYSAQKQVFDKNDKDIQKIWAYNRTQDGLTTTDADWATAKDKYWDKTAGHWASQQNTNQQLSETAYKWYIERITGGDPSVWYFPAMRNTKEQQEISDTYKRLRKDGQKTHDFPVYFNKLSNLEKENHAVGQEINANLQELNKDKNVQYTYINMAKDIKDPSKSSKFQETANAAIRDTPHNYRVIDKLTGKELSYHLNHGATINNLTVEHDGKMKYNRNNLDVLGITTQYINTIGYGFPAKEQLFEADGTTKAGTRDLIIVEKGNNSVMLGAAERASKRGFVVEDIGNNLGIQKGASEMGINSGDAFYAKLRYQEIDKQLAQFDEILPKIPPASQTKPNSETMNIVVSLNKRAEVTINRYADGTYDYDISAWDIDSAEKSKGKKKQYGTHARQENLGYKSRHEVELVLERLAGVQNYYDVPLTTLDAVTNEDIPGAILTNNTFSSNHLTPAFKKDLKNWLTPLSGKFKGFTVDSMTQDKGYNLSIGGSRTSGQLIGEGISVINDNSKGYKAMDNWLQKNAKIAYPGKKDFFRIKDTNLIYKYNTSILDENGTPIPRIDIEYAK